MKILLVLMLVVSCGKRENESETECRTRESMRVECEATHTPTYGRPYATEECSRQYSLDRCY